LFGSVAQSFRLAVFSSRSFFSHNRLAAFRCRIERAGKSSRAALKSSFGCRVCCLFLFCRRSIASLVYASTQRYKRVCFLLLIGVVLCFNSLLVRFAALSCLASPLSPDCASLFFSGVCLLNRDPSLADQALALLRSALQAARNVNRAESLAMISGGSVSLSVPSSSYLLNVVSLLEARHLSALVVEACRHALALVPPADAHVFVSKSFRHNLRLKRFADAYLDVLRSENEESSLRRLRRFVVELCASSSSAQLCEFGFVGPHVEQVAEILAQLATAQHAKDVRYADVL
jgi:hypothetical protein